MLARGIRLNGLIDLLALETLGYRRAILRRLFETCDGNQLAKADLLLKIGSGGFPSRWGQAASRSSAPW